MYQILLKITDKESVDSLILGLVKQGYSVSYDEEEKCVAFLTRENEVFRISSEDIKGVTTN